MPVSKQLLDHMRCRLIVLLFSTLLLLGCASNPQPASSPQPVYIPSSLSKRPTPQLMSVSWEPGDVGIQHSDLSKIDGQSVHSIRARKVYLAPGEHTFTFYLDFSYTVSDGQRRASMAGKSLKEGVFSGEAGKNYTWSEVYREIRNVQD